jgi:hypothetical protein
MVLDSQGAQAKLCIEPGSGPHTFDTSSEPYEFLSENLIGRQPILPNTGIRGTRSEHSIRTRYAPKTVSGTITLEPSPLDLDLWLSRILGAAESSDSFALAETLPAFGIMIDRVAKVYSYSDCYVNKATFSGSQGGKIQLVLDIIGTDFSVGNAGTFPALTLGVLPANQPYAFTDGVFTLAGSARVTKSFELVIDNKLESRVSNSLTVTSITPQDRIVSLKTVHPYTSAETDLLGQALYGATGSIALTPIGGGMSGVLTTFTFGRLQVEDENPVVPGKTAIEMTLNMIARMTGTTRELVVTHDPVPA